MSGDYKPTVVDLLDHMAAVFCDKYCKWPEQYSDDEEEELCKHCDQCPINLLGI